ncbi:alpha/beta fold hydrolase [Methylomonas sp. MgM2]
MSTVSLGALMIGGLFAAMTCARYRRDIGLAYARIATGSRIGQTRHGPIEYAIAGEGPPVLVVHGGEGGYDQGMLFAEPLVSSGFRVIAMSRFGYLRTPLPKDASPPAQADTHAALLDALNVERVSVITASAGVPSAMQLALRHPERVKALVLLVPVAYAPRAAGEPQVYFSPLARLLISTTLRWNFLFWAASKLAPKSLIREFLGTPTEVLANACADEQSRIRRVFENMLPVRSRWQGLLNDAEINATLQRFELQKITVPTLVIGTGDDLFGTLAGARYTADHLPNARFVSFPDGGHLWVGHQNEVMAEIMAFLK